MSLAEVLDCIDTLFHPNLILKCKVFSHTQSHTHIYMFYDFFERASERDACARDSRSCPLAQRSLVLRHIKLLAGSKWQERFHLFSTSQSLRTNATRDAPSHRLNSPPRLKSMSYSRRARLSSPPSAGTRCSSDQNICKQHLAPRVLLSCSPTGQVSCVDNCT